LRTSPRSEEISCILTLTAPVGRHEAGLNTAVVTDDEALTLPPDNGPRVVITGVNRTHREDMTGLSLVRAMRRKWPDLCAVFMAALWPALPHPSAVAAGERFVQKPASPILRVRQWQDTRGQQHQAFGRSRGGFSTKIHLKTDLHGRPLDFHLTGGEASDSTQFETSLDIGPDICPRIAITDKGYDSDANHVAALARGITP
jgi:hypothetical protein